MSKNGGFNLGGINATGQVMEGRFSLIDKDTPQDVYTKASPYDGRQLQLVFSDEFNINGRTFWPGDDPFWEATDLWYWYESKFLF
jgi:beta-glucanase (GH16 family)